MKRLQIFQPSQCQKNMTFVEEPSLSRLDPRGRRTLPTCRKPLRELRSKVQRGLKFSLGMYSTVYAVCEDTLVNDLWPQLTSRFICCSSNRNEWRAASVHASNNIEESFPGKISDLRDGTELTVGPEASIQQCPSSSSRPEIQNSSETAGTSARSRPRQHTENMLNIITEFKVTLQKNYKKLFLKNVKTVQSVSVKRSLQRFWETWKEKSSIEKCGEDCAANR